MYHNVLVLLAGLACGQDLETNSVPETTAFNDRLFALGKLARPVRDEDRQIFAAAERSMAGRELAMVPKLEFPFFGSKSDSGKKKGVFGIFSNEEEDELDGAKRKKKKGRLLEMFMQDSIQAWEEDEDVSDEGAGYNPLVSVINHMLVPASAKRRELGLRRADAELPLDPQILSAVPVVVKRAPLETVQAMKLYAGASSCDPQALSTWSCKDNCGDGTDGTEFVEYMEDKVLRTAGFIALNHQQHLIVVSYRGSSNLMNWAMDAAALPVPYELSELKNSTSSKPFKVHSGFQKMAGSLLNKTRSGIVPLLRQYPKYRVAITGHSAGGAIATLTATALGGDATVPWQRMLLVTLGMPRVGDLIFCAYLNSQPLVSARVTNPTDPVPLLPTQDMGFHHPQHEYFLSDIKRLQDPHTVTACEAAGMSEDPNCARFDTTPKHMQGHFKYFGYFQTNC